jgi:hypothetical protein
MASPPQSLGAFQGKRLTLRLVPDPRGAGDGQGLAVASLRGHIFWREKDTMRRSRLVIALILGLGVGSLAFAGARAQSAVPPVGATVKDVKGLNIGTVERVVLGRDGAPRQVLVRGGRVLRPLPIDGLAFKDGAYVTPLSKAEFEILQPSE